MSKHSITIESEDYTTSSNQTSNGPINISTLPTAAKAQTAKEVIAQNVKLLIAQLEAGPQRAYSLPQRNGPKPQLLVQQNP